MIRAGDSHAAAAALNALVGTLDSARDDNIARFLLGRVLTEAGRPSGLRHLEGVASLGRVDGRRLVWLARARGLAGHDAAAAAALADAIGVAANEHERAHLRLLRAEVLYTLGRFGDADASLTKVAQSKSTPRDLRARAHAGLAKRLVDRDPTRARALARKLLMSWPDTPAAASAGLPLTLADLSDRDRFDVAERLIARFRYHEARRLLEGLAGHPKLGHESRWLLGVIGLKKLRDDPEGARAVFKEFAGRRGPHREDALFYLIRTYVKQDRYDEALALGDRYDREYPRGKYAERVAYYRGWLRYDERKCKQALPHLRRYVKRFGTRRSLTRGFIAWCHIRDKQWQQAIDAYDQLVDYGGALVRGKAWFWQAYAHDQLGRRKVAKGLLRKLHTSFPLTWYDVHGQQMLAGWEGRDARASAVVAWPDGAGTAATRHVVDASAWEWPRLNGETASVFGRVHRLVEIGEVDLARTLYRSRRSAIESRVPAGRRLSFIRFMSVAVEDFKHAWDEVSGGRLGAMMELPDPKELRWALGYPKAYGGLVERLARADGLPAVFVWGIMRQESRYHPSMISAADAVGALQMIPQTAELCAADMGVTYDADTFPDPRVGFPYSTFYMRRHDALWSGQLVLTAASYNAGPEPVRRWLRENDGAPLPFLVEEFSYNEARAYARKVAEHTARNALLYEPDVNVRNALLDRIFPLEVRYDAPDEVGY